MFNFLFKKKDKIKEVVNPEVLIVKSDGIEKLYNFIEKKTGILLNLNKGLLKDKIITLCQKNSINSFDNLLEIIKSDTRLWKELVELITINETYFFREKNQITQALSEYKDKQSLSILCAPSSTGEEVYSIAILAFELGLKNFNILGIDISPQAIQKAKKASYNERSVHKVPQNTLNKYFVSINDRYVVNDDIKKYTNFIECNLFDSDFSTIGKFDLIFSRNMFIYFNDDMKIKAYKALELVKKDKSSKIYLGHADISSKLQNYIN